TCIFCHNTAPYFSSLLGELYGRRAPSYQGEVVDRLLPSGMRSSIAVRDAPALTRALADELGFLSAPPLAQGDASPDTLKEALSVTIHATRERFTTSHLVEVGIGCESCHGGSREHVASVAKRPTFEIRSATLQARPSEWEEKNRAPVRARAINRTCARCHQ